MVGRGDPMLTLIINVSRFAYIFLMVLFVICGWTCYKSIAARRNETTLAFYQNLILIFFNSLSIVIVLLHTVVNQGDLTTGVLWIGIACASMILMQVLAISVHSGSSRLLWNCVMMLLSISIIMLWRLKTAIAYQQIQWMAVCFLIVNLILLIMRGTWIYKIPVILFAILSVALIVLPFMFPNPSGGALNWANIKGFTFQPSEFVKISYVFFIGYLYSQKQKFRNLILTAGLTGVLGIVLLLQNDLGGLLIFCIVFWLMTYEYLEKGWILWGGVLLVAAAGILAYRFVPHVRVRVDAWLNPWADISDGGYQIAHSLFAIVGGGWFGTGLFQGLPTYIPVNTTDMIFSAIAEEFGVIFAVLVILIYVLIFMTMMKYTMMEKNAHKRSLLLGFSILMITQTLVIIGGVTKMLPLTGVTLPFVSYGGSSMLSMFAILAIVQGIIRSSSLTNRKEESHGYAQQPEWTGSGNESIQTPFNF